MALQLTSGLRLTEDEANRPFMLTLEDDEEDSPWMTMGSMQWDATAEFWQSLHEYVLRRGFNWTVGAMLPIRYSWEGKTRKKTVGA